MQSLNLLNSLRGILVLATFVLIVFISMSFGQDTLKEPVKFKWTPCNGNNSWSAGGLKPEILNPAPKKWQIVDFANLNELGNAGLLDMLSDECGKASNGNWYCFFNSLRAPNRGKLACIARAQILQKDDENNNIDHPKPYCAGGTAVSTDYFGCYVFWNGENYDANDSSKKCEAGTDGLGKYIKNPTKFNASTYTTVEWNICQANQSFAYCDSTVVEGPYRNISNMYTACGTDYDDTNGINKGMEYQSSQKELIRSVNKANHRQQLVSDLAGFCYQKPANSNCIESHPKMKNVCREPGGEIPLVYQPPYNQSNAAEINHVLPRIDKHGCPCGKNSNANAVLISKQLNRLFTNTPRTEIKDLCTMKTELQFIKDKYAGNAYLPISSQPLPSKIIKKKKTVR